MIQTARDETVRRVVAKLHTGQRNKAIGKVFITLRSRQVGREQEELAMKIVFVSLPLSGHLHPMTAPTRKLKSFEHKVVFISAPDIGSSVRATDLNFAPYSETKDPMGSTDAAVSKMHGTEVIRYQGRQISPPFSEAGLEDLPELLTENLFRCVWECLKFTYGIFIV